MPRQRAKVRQRPAGKSPLRLQDSTRAIIRGITEICAGILVFLALREEAGLVGRSLSTILTFFFGSWGIIFPVALMCSGILSWTQAHEARSPKRTVGLLLCLAAFLGLVHIRAPLEEIGMNRNELGGAIGFLMSIPFVLFLSRAVGYTVLSALFLTGLIVAFEPDVRSLLALLPRKEEGKRRRAVSRAMSDEERMDDEEDVEQSDDLVEQDTEPPELNIVRPAFARTEEDKKTLKAKAEKAKEKALAAKRKDTIEMKDTRFEEWTFPNLDLLDAEHSQLTVDDEQLKKQAKLIEEKLKEFEIEVTVRDARPGPTVTQFTLEPAEGVRLSKIANLKNDLALALAAPSLRMEVPIPGKSLVGIEMPNLKRTIVHLKEILESPPFVQSASSLSFPLGRDVSGEAVVASLDDMPHLLIAGATGSGKSICMNVFLTALLYQNAPHELKFILIDPKRVELMPFDGIPHLLTPVITEAERALQALRWAVAEMGRRLHRCSEVGAKNIDEFNEKQMEETNVIPRVVIVIDELADLMMRQYRRDTEMMISRIAQMARAAGMHLVIATQRPSVDVITGLIKANIPTRIAFRVVSAVDSRTIIDGIGAEDLLGKGDMLYMTAATPNPVRIQGIFVSTKETERVIHAVKIAGGGKITEQIAMSRDEESLEDDEGNLNDDPGAVTALTSMIDLEADDNGGDDLFFEAIKVVQTSGKASASLLQRQLKVGYARAARLLDIMEEKDLIGPVDGAKARKVYMERTSV